jgi:hypothetical protein
MHARAIRILSLKREAFFLLWTIGNAARGERRSIVHGGGRSWD